MNANDLRPGMIIRHNNELFTIYKAEHRTPGNLRAFVQAKMRNLRTGAMNDHRFRSEDNVERAASTMWRCSTSMPTAIPTTS